MGLVLFSFFYVTNEFTENELQEIHASFPEIETKEEIVGKICRIYKSNSMVFRDNPHSEYITLEDSSRYRLNTGYELKQGLILDETIKLGMLLVKNAGSNNIQLIKLNESDSTIYYFKLTDDLGYGK